jgi:benzoyl-CoA reductase/2-hydroxyglutaryl-CoA dehydratase subunit BcrC/BadD/HgdB
MDKRLDVHLKKRASDLKHAKENGVKIIGYFPGSYVPEEMIYASGAIPVCLANGGDSTTVEASLSVLPRHFCSFIRAQIGEIKLNCNPYYDLIDLLIAPIACQHLKKVAEILEYSGNIKILKLGIPNAYDSDPALEYYSYQLRKLRDRLQVLTGNVISDEKIISAIDLYNSMRKLLREISLLRINSPLPLSSIDFIKLNHTSLYADPAFMVEVLQSIYSDLKEKQLPAKINKPRLLLIGPNVAYGDYKVLEIVEAAGGEIAIEEVSESIRNYWQTISTLGDPVESLARGYLRDRIPCAFMIHSARARLDFALKLIRDFNVSGVIWYELLGCETYDSESYYVSRKLEDKKIPLLILESDYGTSDIGQLKNRIDAFMEIVKGGIK